MERVEIIKLEGHEYSYVVVCGETVLGYISETRSFLPLAGYVSMSTMQTIMYVWTQKNKE
jgi:hypothetical protein